jgi:hypothetical protein
MTLNYNSFLMREKLKILVSKSVLFLSRIFSQEVNTLLTEISDRHIRSKSHLLLCQQGEHGGEVSIFSLQG